MNGKVTSMLKVGVLMATLVLLPGCATLFGEDPSVVQARQQAEQAKYDKHDKLQAEAERLRSEIRSKKSELKTY